MPGFLDSLAQSILGKSADNIKPPLQFKADLQIELERKAWFAAHVDQVILPAYEAMKTLAGKYGHGSHIERITEGDVLFARLEIRRRDHPAGQPLPFLSLSLGPNGREIEANFGGALPGPSDRNFMDASIDWKIISEDKTLRTIADFVRHTFSAPESYGFAHSGQA